MYIIISITLPTPLHHVVLSGSSSAHLQKLIYAIQEDVSMVSQVLLATLDLSSFIFHNVDIYRCLCTDAFTDATSGINSKIIIIFATILLTAMTVAQVKRDFFIGTGTQKPGGYITDWGSGWN